MLVQQVHTNRPSAEKTSIRTGPAWAIENETVADGLKGLGEMRVIAVCKGRSVECRPAPQDLVAERLRLPCVSENCTT